MFLTQSVIFCLALLLNSRCTEIEACGEPSIEPNTNSRPQNKHGTVTHRNPHGRVIGAKTARAHSWPWMVLLSYTSNADGREKMCGATIISNEWLLTAAHCAEGMILSKAKAFIGIQSLSDIFESNPYGIKKKIIHPEYNKPLDTLHNDIALLQLSSKLCFTQYVQPICLPCQLNDSAPFKTGQHGFVTGWGQHTINGAIQWEASNSLLQAEVPFIDSKICRAKWGTRSTQVCAGAHMKGTGKGDSGGPLKVRSSDQRWYQVGITSYGCNDAFCLIDQGKYPGVYTRVSSYCKFIHDNTNSDGDVACSSLTLSISIFAIFFCSMFVHLF